MKHFPVLLTFDMDGDAPREPDSSAKRRPGERSLAQYGPKVAVYEILKLLQAYAVPATFFVPGWTIDHYPEAAAAVHAAGHEIGHHGYTHTPPFELDPDSEREHLHLGIAAIERITGTRPLGYRSPAWDFSEATLPLLAEHGFLYSSNLMDSDAPYEHHIGTRRLVELPVQWCLDDAPFFMFRPPATRPISALSAAYETWTEEFEGLYERDGKVFVLTMHPQFIGRPGRLRMLERFIQFAKGHAGVTFLRCREAAQEVAGPGA